MRKVAVRALKFDNELHREWKAELRSDEEGLITLFGKFEEKIVHPEIGTIEVGTDSWEYYWRDRWFNVFRFMNQDGSIRCYYCNVNMPPEFDEDILSFVDLDLDILVSADFNVRLLDQTEYEENIVRYGYSKEIQRKAQAQVEVLLEMIRKRQFPFDGNESPSGA